MALSDASILNAVQDGDIIIEPFDRRNLATSSYDVTLGEYFYRSDNHLGTSQIYNIYNEVHTKDFWGAVQQAAPLETLIPGEGMKGLAPDDKVILVRPGETILAHTIEFIGGRNHITTMMKARSSMGRQMIAVCKCAGWGDVGYVNRWTLEITNYSNKYTIPLVAGRRIAQLVFLETGPILGVDYSVQGKYQTSDVLEDLKKNWKPEDMLPKLYKDRDIKA